MAKQTTVTLVDDLDGSEADEQVEFAVDGKAYEIDLSAANSARLREALAPFISAARRTGGRAAFGRQRRPVRPSTDREQNQAIREWAAQQGMKISERGPHPVQRARGLPPEPLIAPRAAADLPGWADDAAGIETTPWPCTWCCRAASGRGPPPA